MKKLLKDGNLPRYGGIAVFFGLFFYAVFDLCKKSEQLTTDSQKRIYPIVFAFVLAALAALWFAKQLGFLKVESEDEAYTNSYFPVFTGLLALVCMVICYSFLGVWPVGNKSVMLVDLHHQYAPLLSQLRDTLLNGQSLLYNFDLGMGASYLPLIGYYCASPFNVILLLFPQHLLTEAILVMTLLKNALTAGFLALCLQYVYKKKSYAISVVSVLFTMMMYMIAYSWNIMWLDVIMVLPLIVMGFEMMMREKKFLLYTLSLAYALFVNYYIAFMVCVFMVLYFVVYALREHHENRDLAAGFLRFGGYSVLAAALAAILLIPVAMALGVTSASDGGFAASWGTNFDFFDLLGQHLYDAKPTIRSGNLPNIYCGVLPILLLPLFATTKAIPGRRRAAMVGLFGVMAVSLCVNNLNLLWHGLHSPNDLPYRFSFLYCFALLLIAYETLLHIEDIKPKQIGWSLIGIAAYLVLEEKFGNADYGFNVLYVSFGLILLYAIVTLLISRKRLLKDAGMVLLLLIVVAEMVTATGKTLVKLNTNEYFTNHSDYVDNDTARAIYDSVDAMEQMGDAKTNDGFYRVEFLPRRTCADTALYDYNGITIFASSNPYENTRFMGSLGYAVNGVNSHMYKSFVPVADSLMGIRYVAMNSEYTAPPQLIERQRVTVGTSSYTIYENPNALSLGYFVDPSAKQWTYNYYNVQNSNNSLMSSLTGIRQDVFECLQVQAEGSATVNGVSGISMSEGTTTYTVPVTRSGRLYLYVDCRASKSISVDATHTDGTSKSWTVTPHEPFTIDTGSVVPGDTVRVTLTTETSCGGSIYAMMLNEQVYQQQMNALAANQMRVDTFSDTKIEGSITAPRNGTVMTSMVFDEGWTVKVDGQKVDTYTIGNSLLAFDVTTGTHEITMTFFPNGLLYGIVLFILGVLALVFILLIKKHPERLAYAKKKLQKLKKKKVVPAAVSETILPTEAEPETVAAPTAAPETDENQPKTGEQE